MQAKPCQCQGSCSLLCIHVCLPAHHDGAMHCQIVSGIDPNVDKSRSICISEQAKGGCRQELQRGDAVRIRMSTNPVPTISKTDQTRDWFGSLERCFGWNDRAEQKPLSHIDISN